MPKKITRWVSFFFFCHLQCSKKQSPLSLSALVLSLAEFRLVAGSRSHGPTAEAQLRVELCGLSFRRPRICRIFPMVWFNEGSEPKENQKVSKVQRFMLGIATAGHKERAIFFPTFSSPMDLIFYFICV